MFMLPVRKDVERGLGLWDPFRDFGRMRNEMDRLFGSLWPRDDRELILDGLAWMPLVDVYEDHDQIVVKAEIPGVKKEDVTLSLTDDILTLKGERRHEKEEKRENYFRLETSYGTFQRTIQLPRAVKTDAVKAEYKDGILKIVLPKDEESKTRDIKIDVK